MKKAKLAVILASIVSIIPMSSGIKSCSRNSDRITKIVKTIPRKYPQSSTSHFSSTITDSLMKIDSKVEKNVPINIRIEKEGKILEFHKKENVINYFGSEEAKSGVYQINGDFFRDDLRAAPKNKYVKFVYLNTTNYQDISATHKLRVIVIINTFNSDQLQYIKSNLNSSTLYYDSITDYYRYTKNSDKEFLDILVYNNIYDFSKYIKRLSNTYALSCNTVDDSESKGIVSIGLLEIVPTVNSLQKIPPNDNISATDFYSKFALFYQNEIEKNDKRNETKKYVTSVLFISGSGGLVISIAISKKE